MCKRWSDSWPGWPDRRPVSSRSNADTPSMTRTFQTQGEAETRGWVSSIRA